MIEHEPWVGQDYWSGLDGQRISIVGFSHHNKDGKDNKNLTVEIIEKVMSGELSTGFFTAIQAYFDHTDAEVLWNHVSFFNYLPNIVGHSHQKYGPGSHEQHRLAEARCSQVIRDLHPHKMFVFTRKGWTGFPQTREEQVQGEPLPLGPEFPEFTWGIYETDSNAVMAFGLRHPLFARKNEMRRVVRHIADLPHSDTPIRV